MTSFLNYYNKNRSTITFFFFAIILLLLLIFGKKSDRIIKDNLSFKNIIKLIQSKKKPTVVKKSEQKCRNIAEKIFEGFTFETVRPNFLKYKRGHNLELDMYNPDLKLAIEYQGVQHYKYTPFFHKTEQDFQDLKERDEWKKRRCAEEGIILITVPYTVKEQHMGMYIKSHFPKELFEN